jgi:hypothetical protein
MMPSATARNFVDMLQQVSKVLKDAIGAFAAFYAAITPIRALAGLNLARFGYSVGLAHSP